jgi:hypothetical protein
MREREGSKGMHACICATYIHIRFLSLSVEDLEMNPNPVAKSIPTPASFKNTISH